MDIVQKRVAEQLLFGCKRTAEQEVTIQLSHACLVLGVDKVEKLCIKKHALATKRQVRRAVRRGNTGLGTFNRLELIDAIESSGVLDADAISTIPVKRFAAGRTRTPSSVVRDAWE